MFSVPSGITPHSNTSNWAIKDSCKPTCPSLVSRHILLMRTNVMNLLNRVPEQDCQTFFMLHRMKYKPMKNQSHFEWGRFSDVTLTLNLSLNPNPNCKRLRYCDLVLYSQWWVTMASDKHFSTANRVSTTHTHTCVCEWIWIWIVASDKGTGRREPRVTTVSLAVL